VNFIQTRRHRLVHFVSDRSLLSVVIPVRPLKTALDRHIDALHELLGELAVDSAAIRAELAEMDTRRVSKTRSQSVLASMRDLALNARSAIDQSPDVTCLELSRELSQIPCRPLLMALPADMARSLILERHNHAGRTGRSA
jgi:hypothetical protein